MEPCPKCGWQNHDNAQKCANCFQVLRGGGGGGQTLNQSPTGQSQQPMQPQQPYGGPMQGRQPYGGPGGVQAPPGPAYAGQQRPRMQYFEYVSWPRLGSAFIDGLIYLMVAGGILFAMGISFMDPEAAGDKMFAVYLYAFGFLYEVGLTTACGATLGKMALGIKILKTDGSPIGFGTALGRYLLKTVIAFVPCGGLSYLTILFSSIHQGWYDQVCSTMVVKS